MSEILSHADVQTVLLFYHLFLRVNKNPYTSGVCDLSPTLHSFKPESCSKEKC